MRDKASLAELAVVGSQPARVALKLDTKGTKGVKTGRGTIFRTGEGWEGLCVSQMGRKFRGNQGVFGQSEHPVALLPCLRPVHVGLTAGLTGLT